MLILGKMSKFKRFGVVMAFVALAILITIFDNLSVGITTYEVDKGLPGDGTLRIVQLSDIHMIRSSRQDETLYKKVRDLRPDIIALTGDLVDSGKYAKEEYRRYTIQFCKHLCSVAPVYYVYGNHEFVLLDDPDNNLFKRELEAAGVMILNNRTAAIEKAGVIYNLLGVQDPATLYKEPRYAHVEHKTEAVLTDLLSETGDADLNILLAHRPELFAVYTDEFRVDLTLTGHAHGGQFRLPFTDISAYAPGQGFLPRYTSGVYEKAGCTMIVSRGIGNSIIPVRLFNRPEIVVVDIK